MQEQPETREALSEDRGVERGWGQDEERDWIGKKLGWRWDWGCRQDGNTSRDGMGMAMGEGRGRMETETGQEWGVDRMEMRWEQHENH